MAKPLKIDGDLSLTDTKNRCEQKQRAGFKLTAIKFNTTTAEGKVFQVNEATFEKALASRILDELTFVAAGDSDKLDDIKKKAPGATLITDTKIFVKSHVTRVVVFGKKSNP
jgi:hypothetical protein